MKKKLWFKAKHYGWGWYPVSIEGWLITFLFLVVGIILFKDVDVATDDQLGFMFLKLAIMIVFLTFVCFKTGEKPGWRWGKKDRK